MNFFGRVFDHDKTLGFLINFLNGRILRNKKSHECEDAFENSARCVAQHIVRESDLTLACQTFKVIELVLKMIFLCWILGIIFFYLVFYIEGTNKD